jgi:hypothetical protein
MGIWLGSPLACSINTRGVARGDTQAHTPPCETVATTSSRPNPKILVVREVLAHPRTIFHSYTCELYGGASAVATALIIYDDVEVTAGMTTRRRRP